MKDTRIYSDGLQKVGKMVLEFARTNRVTFHEDGIRPESDTDHTVMLSVCACALAEALYKDTLDLGKVAQFAIVHDLVEAYAKDTDSFGISSEDRELKEERERQALLKIKAQFEPVFPWISETIEEYESLKSREARFVKTVDKCMPKITHIFNKGQLFKNKKLTKEEMWGTYQGITKTLETKYGQEFPEILEILHLLITDAAKATYE